MAIWDYRAELIPRAWIFENYGEIPAVLNREMTIEEAVEICPDFLSQEEPSRWMNIAYPADFVARAEAILPATERTARFIGCGNDGGHRIQLWIENERPDLLGVQLDLREPNLDLFERIVDYARYLDAMIVPDDRFTAVEPEIGALLADIRLSRAYQFCKDPHGYLSRLATQHEPRRPSSDTGPEQRTRAEPE